MGENRRAGVRPVRIRAPMGQNEKLSDFNCICGSRRHVPVLFVQHPSKNAPYRTVRSGSFVACKGTFGNCDLATEGGIPRSSRFRWFA